MIPGFVDTSSCAASYTLTPTAMKCWRLLACYTEEMSEEQKLKVTDVLDVCMPNLIFQPISTTIKENGEEG
jgi:hypothetical protein